MDADAILKLKELIIPDDEERDIVSNPNQGSVFDPGDIGGGRKKAELAKPYTKIEAKYGTKPETIKKDNKKNEIWDQNEIQEIPVSKNDNRARPEFEVLFKQKVGTEDVFLGMSDMDPSSTKCQELLFKIKMPGTKLAEITLDVTKTILSVQSPRFYLYHVLPYSVRDKEGKAQWIADKETLTVSLPIIREDF